MVPGLAQRESDVKDTHLLTSHCISPHLMSCPKAVRHPMFPHQLSNTLPPGCPSQNCTRARSQITITPLHSQAFPSHPIPAMGFKWRQICKMLKYQGFPSSSLSSALEFALITSLITRVCGESTVFSKEVQDLEKQQNKDNKTLHVIHCALQRKRLENRTICSYLFLQDSREKKWRTISTCLTSFVYTDFIPLPLEFLNLAFLDSGGILLGFA